MATRARIGLQLADGNILSVYHHWDGYPQWLGVTLNKKFNTRERLLNLLMGVIFHVVIVIVIGILIR